MLDKIQSKVLNYYQPGFRFIHTIDPDYPKTIGTFEIPERQYTMHDSKGLSGASSIILINQAVIIAFIDNLYNKKIPILEDFPLHTMEDVDHFAMHTLIYNYSNVKFKKIIWKDDPTKIFELNFTKISTKKSKEFISFHFDYSINHGAHSGTWIGVYYKNKFAGY